MNNIKSINTPKNRRNILILILCICFICITINDYYFSASKASTLYESTNETILYPTAEGTTQSFYAPADKTTGFKIYFSSNSTDSSDIINLVLIDNNYNVIDNWQVSSTDIDESGNYFELDNIKLLKNTQYHLIAFGSENNSIGIIAGDNLLNGYRSSSNDGYIWHYQIYYNGFSSIIIVIEIICTLLILISYIALTCNSKTENIISFIYIAVGLLFFIITPINTVYDELGHFYRSYEISVGHLLSEHAESGMGQSKIPNNMQDGIIHVTNNFDKNGANFLYNRELDLLTTTVDNNMVIVDNPNQALYSPFSYIPQSIGLFVASFTTDNVFLTYFYGRFFAFLINSIFIIIAIYILPESQRLIFALTSTPLFYSLSVSYSADGTLNAIAILFVAYIINCTNKSQITLTDQIIIFILSIIIALSKVIYFPLAFFVLLLKDKSFSKPQKANMYKLLTIISSCICFVIWFVIAKSYLFNNQNDRNTLPMQQIKYILSHFYKAPFIAAETIYHNIMIWILQLTGSSLGSGHFYYTDSIPMIFLIVITYELLYVCNNKPVENKKEKSYSIIIFCIILLTVALTFASLYTQWTEYRSNIITGIQGRYLIPLILPLSLIIRKKTTNSLYSENYFPMIFIIIMSNMCALVNTYQIYV